MDCRAYCTATSYQIKPLFEVLKGSARATLYRDVIHVSLPPLSPNQQRDVFYFPYGVTVFWGVDIDTCQRELAAIKAFEENPLDEPETDQFTYARGETPKIVEDEILIPNDDVLNRLAISHGLAQSVKLGTFENALKKIFDKTKKIPDDLAKYGSIPLSRKEIRRKMGELFIERNSINLHVDVLDTPEFFWEYSELEPMYTMAANYLDIETRVEVLNQRLDVVHELFEMLGNELNHQHSSRLEWTIICLIVIEVLLSLLRDVFRVF